MAAARPWWPATGTGADVNQYLSAALSHSDPSALPYPQESRRLIHHHLAALSGAFPSLRPSADLFTYNDGSGINLLSAEGTIPIFVAGGATYYIPLTIWLLEFYPHVPPAVLVSFPPGTAARRGHPLVDSSGAVCIPYLRSWSVPDHNLVDLVGSLSRLFSQDPPFFIPSSKPNYRDLKTKEIDKIMEKVQRDLAATRKRHEAEMEMELVRQSELVKRKKAIAGGLRQLEEELEGLEQQLQLVMMNSDVLQSWVAAESRKRMQNDRLRRPINVDDMTEPSDEKSRQLLECTAADMAVEDVIYALDVAVREGCIAFDVYLKNVRALAREQFFHRAGAKKIRAAQFKGKAMSMKIKLQENA